MRAENPKHYHVLNLIKHVNLENASPKKKAVIALLEWQPEAEAIRFEGRCDACRKPHSILLSYRLPTLEDRPRANGNESCGYFCAACGFGNAGSRPRKIERTQKPGHKPGF